MFDGLAGLLYWARESLGVFAILPVAVTGIVVVKVGLMFWRDLTER